MRNPHVVHLDPADRVQLNHWVRSPTVPQRVAARARILLLHDAEVPAAQIARRLATSLPTVRLWVKRVASAGITTILHDAPGRGRKPTSIPAAALEAMLAAAPLSVRALAREGGRQPIDRASVVAGGQRAGPTRARSVVEDFSLPGTHLRLPCLGSGPAIHLAGPKSPFTTRNPHIASGLPLCA